MRILRSFLVLLLLSSSSGLASAARLAEAPIEPLVLSEPGSTSALVHARPGRLETAIVAARASGLAIAQTYQDIDVFHALGTPQSFQALASSASIEWIEANRRLHLATDSSHEATRGEDVYRGTAGTSPYDGSGVGVAVIDTGIDGTIPALKPALERGANFKILCPIPGAVVRVATVSTSACPVDTVTVDMEDTDTIAMGGHGTHVAGIVAGAETRVVPTETDQSSFTVHGAAPGAALYGIGAGAALTVDNAMDGLQWVLDNHASVTPAIRVVNNSWGTAYEEYRDPDDPTQPGLFIEDGYRLHRALWKLQDGLIEAGVTLVFSAGNSGGGLGSAPTTTGECINPTPGVICVANYNDLDRGSRDGVIDGSSSRGLRSAPATWPDLAAPGMGIVSTCRASLPICATGTQINDEYFALSGTSMSAPHVSGIVAQLLQADPSLTPAEVEDVLEDTAHKFRWGTPYGRYEDVTNPDDESSFEKGHGLVDALAAVGGAETPPVDPAGPDPVAYTASGTILGQAATSFFEPTVESNSSVTRAAFEAACSPDVPPVDGFVFEIPERFADGDMLIAASGGNPFGLWDLNMWLYTEDCRRNGDIMGGLFGDAAGRLAAGSRYAVVTNHFFGVTTVGIAIQPPPLTFTPDAVSSASYSDGAIIGARLTDLAEGPMSGAALRFTLDGPEQQSWDLTTDGAGIARSSDALFVRPGLYKLTVAYLGGGILSGASIERSFTVTPESTALSLSVVGNGSKRTLVATLLDDDGTPVAAKEVSFFGDGTTLGSASTDGTGTATLLLPPTFRGNNHSFDAAFCGDAYHLAAGEC